jgi:branched-chain amino acid transport system ATP-binding protein
MVGLTMPLLVKNVMLKFGGVTALNSVSVAAVDGELLAIIGPNGAGKTALLNCISGVYRPDSGAIDFGGVDLTKIPVHRIALAGVGRAFQHAELFPHMTVTENLLVGRHLLMRTGIFSGALYLGRARREELKQRATIEGIIDFFELYRYRDMPVASLSYGVQKLVGVARALALEPKLLLLDEPSTGLMREEKENFARYLLRIRHELGLTVLWVEHDMQMVADLADRIVVLNYGEVIAEGSPNTIKADPRVIEAYLGTETVGSMPDTRFMPSVTVTGARDEAHSNERSK